MLIVQEKLPLRVVIGRIASITGLSIAVAIGILLLLSGSYWLQGVIALLCGVPFLALLRFVEYSAEHGALRE
jgi:hypothetical protein